MSQAPKAPPPHALSHHWPAQPLLQSHFRCRHRPPPQIARATTTAPVHEKRQSERPTQRPHVRRTRPYHTAVAHTATHTTTTRVTISFDRCATREDHAAVGRVPHSLEFPRALACSSPTATPLLPGRRHELPNGCRSHRARVRTDPSCWRPVLNKWRLAAYFVRRVASAGPNGAPSPFLTMSALAPPCGPRRAAHVQLPGVVSALCSDG